MPKPVCLACGVDRARLLSIKAMLSIRGPAAGAVARQPVRSNLVEACRLSRSQVNESRSVVGDVLAVLRDGHVVATDPLRSSRHPLATAAGDVGLDHLVESRGGRRVADPAVQAGLGARPAVVSHQEKERKDDHD